MFDLSRPFLSLPRSPETLFRTQDLIRPRSLPTAGVAKFAKASLSVREPPVRFEKLRPAIDVIANRVRRPLSGPLDRKVETGEPLYVRLVCGHSAHQDQISCQ